MECKECIEGKQRNSGFPCVSWRRRHFREQVPLHEVWELHYLAKTVKENQKAAGL